MLSFLRNLQDQFSISAGKVASSGAMEPESLFEKIHFLSLDYRTPIIASILYVLVVSFFSRRNRMAAAALATTKGAKNKTTTAKGGEESRFTPFKCLVIAHNILLCLYSATTFLSVLPILIRPYFSLPLLEAFCDVEKKTFNAGVHFWVWNFYVSKYYELLDTAILLVKGKPSSFLQTFHHSGSIVGMWVMTTTHAPAGWIFVLFNSFIHTLMYFYYTLTCLGYRPTWKKILTTMQIIQFLVGNPLGLIYALLPGCLPLEVIPPENVIGRLLGSQLRSLYACLFVNTFFISSLVILFTDFSRKTYGSPAKSTTTTTIKDSSKPKRSKSVSVKRSSSTKPTSKKSKDPVDVPQQKTKSVKSIKVVTSPKDKDTQPAVKKSKTKSTTTTTTKKQRTESPVTTRRSTRSSN